MRLDAFRRSTAARTAAAYLFLFILAITLSYATVYVLASRDANARLRLSIEKKMSQVEAQLAEPDTEMQEAVAAAGPEDVWIVYDRAGNLLAGNVDSASPFDGWKIVDRSDLHFSVPASRELDRFLLWGKESGVYRIVVGEGLYLGDEISGILFSALLWGIGAILLIGGGGAILLASRANRRLAGAETALREFSEGNLGSRLPIAGVDDDLDRISVAINAALVRIETLLKTVQQISTDIAHDLKSPLARLRQTLESAVFAPEGPSRAAIEMAITQADALVETFEALLRIANIEAGGRRARFATVDLALVLDAVVDAFGPAAEDAGQQLTLSISDRCEVKGDKELLTQLFANLVENAIRHGSKENVISVSATAQGHGVTVIVVDRGPGIPEAEREPVLRRFYRLDRSRSTPGDGLGLALVRAITDLHGAKLVLSDANPGLVCTLAFSKHIQNPICRTTSLPPAEHGAIVSRS